VQRFRLERNVNVDVSGEPPRSEVRGETVVIAAPVFSEPVASERPATVKQTIAAVSVDLGWAAIANQDEAKKTRAKMKSEASPSVSPAASQRRGRLLVPGATPSPRTMPSATPQPTAANSPVTTDRIPSTPSPSASPVAPAGSGRAANPRARSQSPRPNFESRHTELMSTASPSPSATTSSSAVSPEATSTSSSRAASTPAPSPGEELTKREKK